jgi:hypothetical protein
MNNEDLFAAQADAVPKELTAVASSKASAEEGLLGKENVVGVGVGLKIKDGEQRRARQNRCPYLLRLRHPPGPELEKQQY